MKQFTNVLTGLLMDILDSLKRIEMLLSKGRGKIIDCHRCGREVGDVLFPGLICYDCYIKEKGLSGK